MADTQKVSPATLLNQLVSLNPQERREWPLSFAVCPRTWPRCLTARQPHTCSASWPICSTHPELCAGCTETVQLPDRRQVAFRPLCFSRTDCSESMSRYSGIQKTDL
jgi:hypothetical protein